MKESNFDAVIATVKARTDIVAAIGTRISLDRNLKASCPFHDDGEPSLSVNAGGQYFYCFGCGVGGDVFKFLELYENKPFLVVLSECAERAGIPLSHPPGEAADRFKEIRLVENILAEAARFYHKTLTAEARRYLGEKRGFSDKTITRFQIGYANEGLQRHLTEECGFAVEQCLKAGILKRADDGEIRDYFHGRIVFPNLRHGRVVHLSGRRLDGGQPKYTHLPGPIEYLFNEDALFSKEVILAEGQIDCISVLQSGHPAVGVLGAGNLKPEYASRFSRCEMVYICFDGDEAGRKGAVTVAGLIGEKARIVQLPDGLDLNDYLRQHSGEDLRDLLASGQSLSRYEISLIPADVSKTELPRRLEPVLKRLAGVDEATAEALLAYEIKPRFKLRKSDTDAYRKVIKQHREQETQTGKGESSKADSKEKYTALFDGLVDLVDCEGQPAFLVKTVDGLAITHEVAKADGIYKPPPREQIPWLLPRGDKVLDLYEIQAVLSTKEQDGTLYDDLLAYHKDISELPGEEYYDLLVAWDFHTYLMETVQYSPVICLFAIPERGKSRTGKGMIHVAHRGIHVESLRDAYLVRVANDLHASIFFDVKDIWKKAEKEGTEDILLHRFEKGARVPRVLYPDRGPHQDIVYYRTFGPTVIATNRGVHRILETRAVQINMPQTSLRFENDVIPELSLSLKERLLTFRARHLGETPPDIRKPARGRLGDILKPLLQMILMVRPEREASFLRLVSELEAERLVEKADSPEAQILLVLKELENQVNRGVLAVKTITDRLNEDRPERFQLSYQRIGRSLAAMGFRKGRAGNNAAIVWDRAKIDQMADSYGLRETHETQESHETRSPSASGL